MDNMATTFRISNGDVVVKSVTGRPDMIGNILDGNDAGKAREKVIQDLKRCISISKIRDGSGAGIVELAGMVDGVGIGSVAVLIKTRLINMFTAILQLQKKRVNIRPSNERFNNINRIMVTPDVSDKVAYRFRIDTKTVSGGTIVQSGTILPL